MNSVTTEVEQTNAFDLRVNEYVKKHSPHVCILTPCYGGMCHVNYFHCVFQTVELCKQFGIGLTIEFCKNDSLVSRARNNLVAKAMSNSAITHILFIDSDISWNPSDVIKLIVSDKGLIGGVYPLKRYFWEGITKDPNRVAALIAKKNNSQLKNLVSDEDMIQHNLLKYNLNYNSHIMNIEHNLAKVKHVATGFMMIKRETINKMMEAFPSTKYVDDVGFLAGDENKYAYALFDCGVEEGHYFSEDWLFCHRWTNMGGSVYIDVSINLTHTGPEEFKGSFVSTIV